MTASRQMRRLGWPLLACFMALIIHFLGLYVAPMRTELRDVEMEIQAKKRQIAYLEAEFSARASADRLNHYNELLYGYGPPIADQYMAGENALADLGEGRSFGPPVMISVADGPDGVRPAGEIGSVTPQLSDIASAPQFTPPIELTERAGGSDHANSSASEKVARKRQASEYERTERLASLDRQLLSDETLRNISVEAERERGQ